MQTRYKYRAADPDGNTRSGLLLAENPDQVLERLTEQELIPIEVKAVDARRSVSLLGLLRGAYYERLIMFTANLYSMFRAGIPLLRALTLIKIGPDGSRFNQAITDIRLAVQSGRPLSQAMAIHDDLFSRVYVASIAAGEESGKLESILAQLRTMLEEELELSRAIKSGIRYPVMVISALVIAACVLLFYVVPKFATFYDQFNAELPLPTRILIGTQHLVASYWPVIVVGLTVAAFVITRFVRGETGRLWLDRQILRLPVFGQLIIKGNVARFSMMFHILFQSGLPIVTSLEIVSDAVKNTAIAAEIKKMAGVFREGRDSLLAKEQFRYFPNVALQMITVGLESGSLSDILKELGGHFNAEVQYTSRQLTSILEPILTLVMGVFVLILALAIFLPMWNLIKVFNG